MKSAQGLFGVYGYGFSAIPVDEIVVETKVQNERFQLRLELQPGVVGIAKIGLVYASRIYRLAIHGARRVSLFCAEFHPQCRRRAIFEEEQLEAGCGGNYTQTAGYQSLSGAIWLDESMYRAPCTWQTRSRDDAKHAFKWLQQSGYVAMGGLAQIVPRDHITCVSVELRAM